MKIFLINYGWKLLGITLILYAVIFGLLIQVPDLPVIHQSLRSLFYHVAMWFTMFFLFLISFVFSICYLSGFRLKEDILALEAAKTAVFFGILGIITGMIWAKYTWGTWWVNDPKLNGAAVSLIAYFAYLVLRSSIDDIEKKAKISAVYNIFAFVLLLIFIGVLPRLAQDSLHPGNKGSTLTVTELDNTIRWVFYPSVLGWILVGTWLLQLRVRIHNLSKK
jgi:heme exporter protein C